MVKKCLCCGNAFEAPTTRRKFCESCLEIYKRNPPTKQRWKVCPVCNEIFVPINDRHEYCGQNCKMQAQRERLRKRNAEKREKERAEKEKKRKRREKKPKINTEWWKKFDKADNLTKDAMLARRFGYGSYATFIAAISQGKEDRKMLIVAAMMEEKQIEERRKKDEAI